MDDHDQHWHDEAASGLHLALWVALAIGIASRAGLGWIVVKAIANLAAGPGVAPW